jgi:hypothetical protein
MAIDWHEDKGGYLVYENTKTKEKVRIWGDTLAEVAFICQDWHGGQWSPCYRMMSGDYSYKNLERTLSELQQALHDADGADEDDYLDLATAVEDLEGIVDRIAKIADVED